MATKNKPCCEPEAARIRSSAVSKVNAEELAKLAWAVAHPARVQLLSILMTRSSCVCGELVEAMPLAQSTVSQHLKILKEAGLIQGEINGPKVCYCVNRSGLARLKKLVAGL
jgi:ArsR family transcriptional regulator